VLALFMVLSQGPWKRQSVAIAWSLPGMASGAQSHSIPDFFHPHKHRVPAPWLTNFNL
jgi:hypothetical protein